MQDLHTPPLALRNSGALRQRLGYLRFDIKVPKVDGRGDLHRQTGEFNVDISKTVVGISILSWHNEISDAYFFLYLSRVCLIKLNHAIPFQITHRISKNDSTRIRCSIGSSSRTFKLLRKILSSFFILAA